MEKKIRVGKYHLEYYNNHFASVGKKSGLGRSYLCGMYRDGCSAHDTKALYGIAELRAKKGSVLGFAQLLNGVCKNTMGQKARRM